ncbi:MAG TPA: methyltransferase, partial [Longimicrobiales bacterium]|nr:methyltransferase [Longimicrobiales bacterium]
VLDDALRLAASIQPELAGQGAEPNELESVVATIRPRVAGPVRLVSVATGAEPDVTALTSAEYWAAELATHARRHNAILAACAAGARCVIEIGTPFEQPGVAVAVGGISDSALAEGAPPGDSEPGRELESSRTSSEDIAIVTASESESGEGRVPGTPAGTIVVRGAAPDGDPMAAALEGSARLYVAGWLPDWKALAAVPDVHRVIVPGQVFLRRRFWFGDASPSRAATPTITPAIPTPTVVTDQAPQPDRAGQPQSAVEDRGEAHVGEANRGVPGSGSHDSPRARAWRAAVEAALVAAGSSGATDFGAYPAKWRALNELAGVLCRNALVELGAFPGLGDEIELEHVLGSTGARPVYRHIVSRCLEALAVRGVLARTARGYVVVRRMAPLDPTPYWAEVERALADDLPLLDYVRHAGGLFADVLVGRVAALETLFPGGSLELAQALYERSAILRYVNGIAAAALGAYVSALPAGTSVRVLEVGAGTGGTTAWLLPVLPPDRTSYDYTDVSDVFLDHGRERFAGYGFLRTLRFDLEKGVAAQGFQPGSYDVIVAANAVHAASSLRPALARLRGMLAPGGLLLLVESTGHLPWHDITTGLIEGWQRFDDDLRVATPLLDVSAWQGVLAACGFNTFAAAPQEDSPAAILHQNVLLAQAPIPTSSPPLSGRWAESASRPAPGEISTVARPTADPAPPPTATHAAAATPADVPGTIPGVRDPSFLRALFEAPEAEREEIAIGFVRECVMRVMHADPGRPPSRDARLMELGVDSLMAVRLRNALQAYVPQPLPSTLIFDYPTIARIAALLAGHASSAAAPPTSGT